MDILRSLIIGTCTIDTGMFDSYHLRALRTPTEMINR